MLAATAASWACPSVLLQSGAVASLALYGTKAAWWQFLSSAFVHASWLQLSRNSFLIYFFGRYAVLCCAGVSAVLGSVLRRVLFCAGARWEDTPAGAGPGKHLSW